MEIERLALIKNIDIVQIVLKFGNPLILLDLGFIVLPIKICWTGNLKFRVLKQQKIYYEKKYHYQTKSYLTCGHVRYYSGSVDLNKDRYAICIEGCSSLY